MTDGAPWSQRVLVLRHGERQDHAPDAPPDFDPPLTSAGKAAIPAAATRVKKILGASEAKKALILVSPFTRCVETAAGLQSASVGSESAYIVDNGVCEVFGPVRIKHPERPLARSKASVPPLPKWGETLAEATERFVASFQRIADTYANTGSHTLGRTVDSDLGCPADTPEAVTNRVRLPQRRADASRVQPNVTSPLSDFSVGTSGGPARDIIIVTHGDALSAVLNYFYPSRTVYEAEYLSFLVMKRYGVGNTVFHLDDSVGVHWILDGLDGEPKDALWAALRETSVPSLHMTSGYDYAAYLVSDPDEFSDDAEDNCGRTVPQSSVKRRMDPPAAQTNRAVRAPSSSRASNGTTARAVPCAQAEKDGIAQTPTAQKHSTPPTVTSPTQPTITSPHTPGKVHRKKSSHGLGHPKGSEDCDRLHLPDGTPSQSSINDTLTLEPAPLPTLQLNGHPQQNVHSRDGVGTGGAQQRPPAPTMDSTNFSATVIPTEVDGDDGRGCLFLLKHFKPLRRSCALRLVQCLSQLFVFAAVTPASAAVSYFLAALVVEMTQGTLLFLSTLNARVNGVRQSVEYLLCTARCHGQVSDAHVHENDPPYVAAMTSSNSPSHTFRATHGDDDHADVPRSDTELAIHDAAATDATDACPMCTFQRVLRHVVASGLKIAVVFLLSLVFGYARYKRHSNALVLTLTLCVYAALNVVRGVADEYAEFSLLHRENS